MISLEYMSDEMLQALQNVERAFAQITKDDPQLMLDAERAVELYRGAYTNAVSIKSCVDTGPYIWWPEDE